MQKSKRTLSIEIFVLLFLSILAPALKLSVNNQEYFKLSLLEVAISAFFFGGILALPLVVLSLIDLTKKPIYILVILIFVATVISTYLIPVNLSVLDGGNTVVLQTRTEAFIFFILTLIIFISLLISNKFWPQYEILIFNRLKLFRSFAAAYLFFIIAYSVYSFDNLTSFSGSSIQSSFEVPVSNESNIFILSFDQVQGSFLKGYLESHPDKADVFGGFIFFPDAAATYPNTEYSIASTLLGRIVANASETANWVMDSSASILAEAEKDDYDIYVVNKPLTERYKCILCNGSESDDHAFNYLNSYELLRHGVNLAFGLDLNHLGIKLPRRYIGRYDPELIDHIWQMDLHEFESFSYSLTVSNEKSTIFFMHLLGTHQPFIYDENCIPRTSAEISSSQTIEGAEGDITCMVNLLDDFFANLRQLSIYDQSMIFIVSDHGYERNINLLQREENGKNYFEDTAYVLGDARNIKPVGSYNPIFLFKDFGPLSKSLEIDDSPVSLIDISPTICSVLKGCIRDWEGISLYTDIDPNRERSFWEYLGGAGAERHTIDGLDKLHFGLDEWWEIRSFHGAIYPNLAYAMGLDN